MVIMCKGGWTKLSIFLIIIFHNLVTWIMDSVEFKYETIFIMIFFLFFKNCNYDSMVLREAQPYVLFHQYMIICLIWDLFHCVWNNVSSNDHLFFFKKEVCMSKICSFWSNSFSSSRLSTPVVRLEMLYAWICSYLQI